MKRARGIQVRRAHGGDVRRQWWRRCERGARDGEDRCHGRGRWVEGVTNATALCEEIRGQGYTGGTTVVKDFVRPWRNGSTPNPTRPKVRQSRRHGRIRGSGFERFRGHAEHPEPW